MAGMLVPYLRGHALTRMKDAACVLLSAIVVVTLIRAVVREQSSVERPRERSQMLHAEDALHSWAE